MYSTHLFHIINSFPSYNFCLMFKLLLLLLLCWFLFPFIYIIFISYIACNMYVVLACSLSLSVQFVQCVYVAVVFFCFIFFFLVFYIFFFLYFILFSFKRNPAFLCVWFFSLFLLSNVICLYGD